ncbi:MAG: Rnf-Nqr domain containing protein, partial [Bacilli bacterium]
MRWIRIKYTKWYNILKDGISKNNPIVVAVLGICSALAVTNRVENAIAMGLGVTFVVMASSLMISLIRNFIPAKVRMVTYMVVISTFVILFQMFLEAYFPSIAKALGAYVG